MPASPSTDKQEELHSFYSVNIRGNSAVSVKKPFSKGDSIWKNSDQCYPW